jgi:hypothetical protein
MKHEKLVEKFWYNDSITILDPSPLMSCFIKQEHMALESIAFI